MKILKDIFTINDLVIRQNKSIAVLDGLRGIAIILVLMRHITNPIYVNLDAVYTWWNPISFFRNGLIGVDLFFILSGFLITMSFISLKKSGEPYYLKKYLIKRVLRIFPAYYTVLFLVIFGFIPGYTVYMQSEVALVERTIYHLIFMQDYLGNNIVSTFWSLGVEEKFYLIMPFILIFLLKNPFYKKKYIVILLFISLGPIIRLSTVYVYPGTEQSGYQYIANYFMPLFYYPFHACLDPLFIGVFIAFLYMDKDKFTWCNNKYLLDIIFWICLLTLFIITTTHIMYGNINLYDQVIQRTLLACCFGGIMLSLLLGAGYQKLFETKFLLFFAKISYSLYLIHIPLQQPVINWVQSFTFQSVVTYTIVYIFIYLIISIFFALLLYYLIEKPFLSYKNKIYPHVSPQAIS